MRRVNLLHAHGSPTGYLYRHGCGCAVCRAALAEAHRGWVRRNPERALAANRADKAKNRERTSAYYRRWSAANPDKVRNHWTAQRARRKKAKGDHTAADLRAQIARQKGRCFYCKTRLGDRHHAEHVMPVILGGSNGRENIVAACPGCNQSKAAKHPMDFAGILF